MSKTSTGRKRGAAARAAPRKRASADKATPAPAAAPARRRRARERTIADILDAAERLLDEKGPDGFGLAELGRNANISFGLIHHYFGGKEGLLKAVLRRTLRGMGSEIRRLQDDHSFWQRDAPAVQVVFDTFAERRGFARLLAWGLLTGLLGPEDIAHEFRQERDALGSMLEAFRAEAPYETRNEVAVITTLLVSSVLGFNLLRPLLVGSVEWNRSLDERLRAQLVSAMVELTQHQKVGRNKSAQFRQEFQRLLGSWPCRNCADLFRPTCRPPGSRKSRTGNGTGDGPWTSDDSQTFRGK